jgi:hypothetical protein
MRQVLSKYPKSRYEVYSQAQVADFLIAAYPDLSQAIEKLKFYCVRDKGGLLRFFIMWCAHNVEAREVFFEAGEHIASQTGWYPMVTGHRVFHHQRGLVDLVDMGLRKAMNKTNIESLPGLGALREIKNLSRGQGNSILVQSSTYDVILDAGMSEDDLKLELLRYNSRKWLFISHSHKDHTGGMTPFVKSKKVVISSSPITLELFLQTISCRVPLDEYLPKSFFYRFAPMWYRSCYRFSDGSSIEVVPTYHFPGSMGFIFTFADGKTLFYSGDLNVSASYLSAKLGQPAQPFVFDLGRPYVDYAILDGAFIGRKIGTAVSDAEGILDRAKASLSRGRNLLFLTPSSDYGLFLFLHLYDELISGPYKGRTRVFLDPGIMRQLEILEWRMKRKQWGCLDNALMRFLASRVTLAESARVFDVSVGLEENLRQLNSRGLQVVMILDDVEYEDYLSRQVLSYLESPGLDVSRIARAATRPADGVLVEGARTADFDGGIWLLHSQEQILYQYLLSGSTRYGQVFFFHNFPGRLKRFIKCIEAAGYDGKILARVSHTVCSETEKLN